MGTLRFSRQCWPCSGLGHIRERAVAAGAAQVAAVQIDGAQRVATRLTLACAPLSCPCG